MKDVVIVSACRTAIGAFGGTLKDLNGATLAATTMKEAIKRAGIDPAIIDDVRYGTCVEHHDTLNTTRVAALLAGIPDTVPACTINRVCISGMEAVLSGMAMIHALHCGSYILPFDETAPVDTTQAPASFFLGKPYIMGHTAEFIAQKQGISREEMDEVALRSHNNAERATKDGSFAEEIVPVEVPQKRKDPLIFDKDEHFRPGMTLEKLAALPPAFVPKIGKVTAGNASGINDGATGMVIMSAQKADELGLTPLARIKASGMGACHPSVMGLSPVPAVKDLMDKSGLKIADFDLMEVNEAFAAQYIGCENDLGLNREITNVNGSGIGLGHPVGSTGARVITTLIYAMKKRGDSLGLATLCGGGGVAMACAVEMI